MYCLGWGFTQAPGLHVSGKSEMFGWRILSKSLPWELLQSRLYLRESHQMVTPPQRGSRPLPQAIETTPQRTNTCSSQSPFSPPWFSSLLSHGA